ncbi:uncharacterized protein LOC125035144 isoform X2 [Penaeus chinensis]|nr:uncharacterized protein LOC125035144 isoform X2 [Penaeus chinensis]
MSVKEGSTIITLPALPVGPASEDTFLMAHFDQECSNCHLPKFLFGKKPTTSRSPTVYAVIHSCHSAPVRTSHHVTKSYDDNLSGRERLSLHFSEQDFAADAPLGTSAPVYEHPLPLSSPQAPSTAPSTQAHARKVVSTSPTPANSQVVSSTREPRSDNDNRPYYDNGNDNLPVDKDEGITSNSNYTEFHNNPNLHGQESTPRPLTSTIVSVLNSTNQGLHKSDEKIATTFAPFTLSDQKEGVHSYHLNHDEDDQLSTQRPVRTRKREINEESQVFTVTYWMFYPYNYGKDVCTINLGYYLGRMYKLPVNGTCFGEEIAMGKHVGDWEHVSIQFRGTVPLNMYVSSHNFGAYYQYDSYHQHFEYSGQDTRKGIPMSPEYPKRVRVESSHPVLYSARGSHGLWAAPGLHQYNTFPQLQDLTDEGTEWRTWLNLDVIDLKDHATLTQPHRQWLGYEGRWGNPKSKCHTLMAGFCELNQGPTGIPKKRINFPCIRKS